METEQTTPPLPESLLQCRPDQLPEYFASEERRVWELVGASIQVVMRETRKELIRRFCGSFPVDLANTIVDESVQHGLIQFAKALVAEGVLAPDWMQKGELDGNEEDHNA